MNYKDSGVDLHEQNVFNAKIHQKMPWLGGFGGAYDIGEDSLVSWPDSVGSKVMLYEKAKHLDGVDIKNIGIDLVATVMNDIVCTGAQPMFFNDYLSINALDTVDVMGIIDGINDGLKQCGDNVPLISGETSVMNDMHPTGGFDVAGFGVGACPKGDFIDGINISEGDVMLGLKSSGFHTDGYALIRKVLDENIDADLPDGFYQKLLTPTRIYVKSVLSVLKHYKGAVHGISQITGGGRGNINRLIGEDVNLRPLWNNNDHLIRQDEMSWIQRVGNISQVEMRRVFNNGIGMVLIVDRNSATTRLTKVGMDNLNKTIEKRS